MPLPNFITIVSGLPRSGTSLMMQMLEAGGLPPFTDGLRAPDEDNPGGYYEHDVVKRTRHDCSWVQQASGLAVKVVYALLRYLPAGYEYRVILMRRDPEEIISSQTRMLRRLGSPGAALPPDRMANAFAADLAEVLAEISRRPEFRLLEVDYKACVFEPATVVSRVNEHLGNVLNEAGAARIPNKTLYRQRA